MFAANLRHLRNARGWSQHQLAERLGIPRTTLAGYELSKSEPNLALLRKIAATFGITLDRLIKDDLASGVDELVASDGLRVLAITTDSEHRENIELVRSQAFAGYAQHFQEPEYVAQLPRISLPMLADGTYRAFEIRGDSMLPMEAGWIVICHYVEALADIRDGRCYVVVLNDGSIVYKRLYRDKDSTTLIATSDNALYAPFTIQPDQVAELWQYRAHLGFNDRSGQQADLSVRLQGIEASLQAISGQLGSR